MLKMIATLFLDELQLEDMNFIEDDPEVWYCKACLEVLVVQNRGSCRHTEKAFNDSIIIIHLSPE